MHPITSRSSIRLIAVATLLTLTFAAACGGGEEAPAPASTPAATSAPMGNTPDLSNAGTLTGRVMFSGDAPADQTVQMSADPFCLTAHTDAVMVNPVMVGEGGALLNVVVHVSGGLEDYTFGDVPSEPATLDQNGCMYMPHAIALRTGQPLVVRNSDNTLHNVNVQPNANPGFNQAQPMVNTQLEKTFDTAEVGISARCDVHAWMGAFISVFDHPYFAISDAGGSFDLGQLPPGDYTVEAWHETLGTQSQQMTVGENAAVDISISFGS